MPSKRCSEDMEQPAAGVQPPTAARVASHILTTAAAPCSATSSAFRRPSNATWACRSTGCAALARHAAQALQGPLGPPRSPLPRGV